MARTKIWKWLRRLAIAVAAVVLLVLLAVLLRVPERVAGFVVGRALGTSVTIQDLDFHSLRLLTVSGIEVGAMEGLDSATVDVVEVRGFLTRALRGEVDGVTVAGARGVLLLPSPWLEESDEERESPFHIGILSAEGVEAMIRGADGSTAGPFHIAGNVQNVGGEMEGGAEVRASETSIDPLLQFALDPSILSGRLRDLQATLHLGADGGISAKGELGRLHLERGPSLGELDLEALQFDLSQGEREGTRALLMADRTTARAPTGEVLRLQGLDLRGNVFQSEAGLELQTTTATLEAPGAEARSLPPPLVKAQGVREQDGAWRMEIVPELEFVEKARARLLWHLAEPLPRQVEGAVKGIRLAALQAWVPVLTGWDLEGLEMTGLANLEVTSLASSEDPSRIQYRLDMNLPRLVLPAKLSQGIPGNAGPRAFQEIQTEVSGELGLASLQTGGPLEASLSVASGDLPSGILPLRGTLSGQLAATPSPSLEGTLLATTARVGRLEGRGSLKLPLKDAPEGTPLEGRWTWAWKKARLAPVVALLRTLEAPLPEDLVLDGIVGADGVLHLDPTLRLEGKFQLSDGAGEGAEPVPWSLGEVTTRGRFSWAGDRLTLPEIHLEAAAQIPPLPRTPFAVDAAGLWNLDAGAGELRAMTFDAGDLGTLSATGQATSEGRLRASLNLDGTQLGALRNLLRSLTGEFASGLKIQGTAKGEFELTAEDGAWTLEGPATVVGSGFASDDGSRVLEGFESEWQTKVVGSTDRAVATHLVASADVTGFQLLWELFYGDFSALESTLSIDGTLEPLPPGADVTFPPWHMDVAWTVPEGPSLGLRLDRDTATLETADLRYSLAVRLADLERSYSRYLQGPLTDFSPRFSRVRVAGDLGADLEGAFLESGGTTMQGQLLAEGIRVEGIEGQLAVRDLDLDFPVDLAWSTEGQLRRQLSGEAAPELSGSVRFESADLQDFRVPSLRSILRVRGDAVRIEEEVSVPLAGGRVAFEGLTLVDLLTPERFAETAVRIESLNLERLAAGFGLPPLDGMVDGRLPRVRIDATTLEVDGGGEASLFGGTVRIGSISGENVLSRFPKVAFSAEFEDIDLGRLTRRFDIGEMNGVLQGSLQDCELFRWVPVRCAGRFETVKRKGFKRNIGVKAINNIAILGTGQGLGFLDKGIRSFFDKYTYSRLGVAMTLENDVFLLRGLEHRGDRELFLRGRLPFPIDVVNAQPGRTVSFQTMLRRLQTLDFNNATSSPTTGG